MQVYWDKFLPQSSEDIQHAPFLSINVIKVEFSQNLVNVIKVLYREILKSRVLASLAVDFDGNMAFEEFVYFYHIKQRMELLLGGFFWNWAYADVVEVVISFISAAGRNPAVGAVVHMVGHIFNSWKLTAEIVVSVDAYVDESLTILHKVLADQIASIWWSLVSDSLNLAVSVLN